MKCPKCDKEIEAGSVFCIFCGSPVEVKENTEEVIKDEENTPIVEEKDEANEVIVEEPKNDGVLRSSDILRSPEPVENAQEVLKSTEEPQTSNVLKSEEPLRSPDPEPTVQQTVAPNVNATQNMHNKKRHSIITVAILGVVVVVAILVVLLCMSLGGSPEKIYKSTVTAASNALFAGDAATSESANISTSVQLSTDIEELASVDGISADVNLQYDLSAKEIFAKAKVKQNDVTYLDGQMFMNILEKKIYVGETSIYDKLISVDIPEETLTTIEDALAEVELRDKSTANTIAKSFANAINNNLDKEYFSSEKVTVTIDSKEKKVTDNALILTGDEIQKLFVDVIETLKEDDKFLKAYGDSSEDLVTVLDLLKDEVEATDIEAEVEVHYYTSGLFDSFVGAAVVLNDTSADETVAVEVIAKEDNNYEVALKSITLSTEQTILTANVKVNEMTDKEMNVEFSVGNELIGEIALKVVTTQEYGVKVEEVNVADAVNVEDLTEDDLLEISDNLENSALYTVLESYMGAEDDYDYEDDDYDYDYDDEELPAGVTLKNGQSCVITYDDDVVKFMVPSTFEEDYGGNSYKVYAKEVEYDTSRVYIDAEWDTVEDYAQYLDESLDYLKDMEGYVDIKVSDAEEVEVNGVTFNKKITSYTYKSGNYSHTYTSTYYYTKINDEYTYAVEVDDEDGLITDSELTKFLTIEME
ncbi:MAG: zinc ribbon domain-containing protein [Clostridia bacterium]|nr:zinc ribbon domain-containing protein [Clostridia bacterium]